MNDQGSIQLRRYKMAREYGHLRADAAEFAGISQGEALLIDRDNGWAQPDTKQPRSNRPATAPA